MPKKVFLLGATGFNGSRVLDVLLSEPSNWVVTALVRTPESAAKIESRGVRTVMGDLTVPGSWQDAAREADCVIHVAQPARFAGPDTHDFGLEYARGRERQDKCLFDTLKPGGAQRIVYVSGHSYFGDTGTKTLGDETMSPNPVGMGPYIVKAVEQVRRELSRGLDIVSVYLGSVYGVDSPWLRRMIIDPLLKNESVLQLPGRSHLCSPIHVVDSARATVWMAAVGADTISRLGRDYLLVDTQPVAFRDLIEEFARALDKPVSYRTLDPEIAKSRMGEIIYSYQTSDCAYSNRRLLDTGFSFKFPTIREGARDVVAALGRIR